MVIGWNKFLAFYGQDQREVKALAANGVILFK
jgi:hypothetical protein